MKRLIFLLLLTAPFCIRAEVYSLWPFGKGKSGFSAFSQPSETLPVRRFWKENVRVNGIDLVMDISLVDLPYDDAVAVLQKTFPSAVTARNASGFMLSLIGKDGRQKRVLLLSLAGSNPTLQFSMELPPRAATATHADWPKTIPLPQGAGRLFTIRFPERKADFASCFLPGQTRPQVLADMTSRLQAQGWNAATGEIADPFKSTGEVFFREKPMEILLLGAAAKDQGVMMTVYTRPLER